jgi:hypothetical protein
MIPDKKAKTIWENIYIEVTTPTCISFMPNVSIYTDAYGRHKFMDRPHIGSVNTHALELPRSPMSVCSKGCLTKRSFIFLSVPTIIIFSSLSHRKKGLSICTAPYFQSHPDEKDYRRAADSLLTLILLKLPLETGAYS